MTGLVRNHQSSKSNTFTLAVTNTIPTGLKLNRKEIVPSTVSIANYLWLEMTDPRKEPTIAIFP